jgi:hypothetical protein
MPNVLEISYSTENVSNDIVNFIRNLNESENSTNVITTHSTISRNTEIFVKGNENENNSANDNEDEQENQNENEPEDMCVICREEMGNTDILRKIKKCGHYFHVNCLDRWLESKITCPSCRADIRLDVQNDSGNANNDATNALREADI